MNSSVYRELLVCDHRPSRRSNNQTALLLSGIESAIGCILGAHVDNTITGGHGAAYHPAVQKLRTRVPFRKWRSVQDPNSLEISFCQKEYAEHIQLIKINKERA